MGEEKNDDVQDLKPPHLLSADKDDTRSYIFNLALIIAVIISISLNILQLGLYKLNISPIPEGETGTHRSKYGTVNILLTILRERYS